MRFFDNFSGQTFYHAITVHLWDSLTNLHPFRFVFDTLATRDSVLEYDSLLKKHIYLDNKSFYWNGGQILGDKHSDTLIGSWYRYGNNLHCCCYIHFDLLMRKGKEHECSRRHLDKHLFVYHASKYQKGIFNVICAYSSFRPCDTLRRVLLSFSF